VKVAFSLEERLRRQERPKPKPIDLLPKPSLAFQQRYDYIPTGELVVKAWHNLGSKSEWADGKRQRVEDKLNDFMIAVVGIADHEIRSQEQRVIYERQRREEERLRWERQRLQEEENYRGECLAKLAGRWRDVEFLRQFIAAVRERAAGSPGIAPDSQLDRWLQWATNHASRLDPLTGVDQLPPPYSRRVPWDTGQTPVEWPPPDP
jgi:hypothetical protein